MEGSQLDEVNTGAAPRLGLQDERLASRSNLHANRRSAGIVVRLTGYVTTAYMQTRGTDSPIVR